MLLFCSIFYETVVNTNSYQQCYGSLIKWKVKYITFLFDKLLIFLRVLFGGKVSDGTVFVSLSYDVVRVAKFSDGTASLISSNATTELSILLLVYLLFSKIHKEDSKFNLFCAHDVLLNFFNFDLSFIFYHQTYIHIFMVHALLRFLIHLFL